MAINEVQAENRAERVAIMVCDGKQTEEAAQQYCDTRPELYGIREDQQ